MAECSVAGCGKAGDEAYFVGDPFGREVPVCDDDAALLGDENDWFAVASGDDRDEIVIHVGVDVPSRVMAVSAQGSAGNSPGLLVHLTLLRNGSPSDLTVLMSHDEADVLAAVLQRR